MNIQDFLLKYRKPLFAPEDGAPSGGDGTPAGEGTSTALTGDAGGNDTAPAEGGNDTAPSGDGNDTAPSGDGDDADGGDDADKDGDGGDAPAEFKLTAPEGMEDFQGEFDTFSSEASDWMQANPKATPADALKWAADRQAQAVTAQTQEMSEAFTRQIETWEGEAKADKEIGGEKFDANLATAKKAIEAFGSDELKAVLNESGLGSHPEVIKFAFKAGKALEDAPVITTGDGTAKKSLAESMYGKD